MMMEELVPLIFMHGMVCLEHSIHFFSRSFSLMSQLEQYMIYCPQLSNFQQLIIPIYIEGFYYKSCHILILTSSFCYVDCVGIPGIQPHQLTLSTGSKVSCSFFRVLFFKGQEKKNSFLYIIYQKINSIKIDD